VVTLPLDARERRAPVPEIQRSLTSYFMKMLRVPQPPFWGPKTNVQFPQLWCSTLTVGDSDTRALRKILRIPYTRHVSNTEVRRTTGCSPLSHLVTNRRLRLFGHIARSSPHEDHHRALAACIRQLPSDWKRRAGRPSHTWLRAIEADLGPLNFGLTTAWRKASTRDEWRHIVNTATLQRSTLWKKERR